jgi:hypothetical protein
MSRNQRGQRGVALVLAIFTLMLISVVGTALILMAGTETAIKSNYKSAMHAFYDAKAGLEEGRGRLSTDTAFANCVFPAPGTAMPVGRVCYIINPSAGEVVNPLDLSAGNPYADTEYKQEFPAQVTSANVQTFVNSNSAIGAIAGPLYKWVRITATTEYSSNIAVSGSSTKDNTTPLYYIANQNQEVLGPAPGATQVLSITALAFTPYGSRRMVQYSVAAGSSAALSNLPSALILDGNGVTFTGPGKSGFYINGNDIDAPSGTPSGVGAIGFTNSSDSSSISAGAVPTSNYLSPSGVTAVGVVSLPAQFQTPSSLEALVQSITQSADKVIVGPVTQSDSTNIMPAGMSATNPMTTVVQGDLTINGWHGTGYGLLVVTGTLTYDPDASWNGIILVIGNGQFVSTQSGTGQINGVLLIAQTRDASGNLLSALGSASFKQTAGSNGIHYSTKSVTAAQPLATYQVLSFREIAQATP